MEVEERKNRQTLSRMGTREGKVGTARGRESAGQWHCLMVEEEENPEKKKGGRKRRRRKEKKKKQS